MSDFDKEAERERLREKYEDDRRERQSTQRMSELLLKGATMTNRHCDDCGDPIFRYEGTEFCATCRHEATDGETADGDGGAGGDATAAADAAGGAAAGDGTADAATDPRSGETNPSAPSPGAGAATDADDGRRTRRTTDREATAPTDGATRAGGERTVPDRIEGEGRAGPPAPVAGAPDAGESGAGRAAARASLERSLARFARAAEGTDDPRRARDLLAAAREAAEALAALDGR